MMIFENFPLTKSLESSKLLVEKIENERVAYNLGENFQAKSEALNLPNFLIICFVSESKNSTFIVVYL